MSNVMTKVEQKVDELRKTLEEIELSTMEYTLADAIREGASVTGKSENWGDGDNACTLTAATLSAKARGYV